MIKSEHLEQTIEGCKRGDAQCFARIVDTYAPRCYGYFYRLTGNRDVCDDMLGELFVKLTEKFSSYRGGSFESWLFRIASNVFNDYLRVKQRQKKLLDKRKEYLEFEFKEFKPVDNEKIDRLQAQLFKLDTDTRELIMLRFYSQLSFREIAEIKQEPLGTILSKVHRGLNRLRQLME